MGEQPSSLQLQFVKIVEGRMQPMRLMQLFQVRFIFFLSTQINESLKNKFFMKKFIFPAFLLLFLSCTSTGEAQSKLLKPNDFESIMKQDNAVQLVDVRTPEEFNAGHLEGASHIDFYNADFKNRISKLDKNKPVMVYCAAGGRSASAADQFTSLGFTKVYDLNGGIRAWQSSGKKTVK